MKYINILILSLFFTGCGTKIEYVDRPVEVKVPVQCKVDTPKKPNKDISPIGFKQILVYAEQLECALKLCKGESCTD